jgi:hypothetical protein
VNKLGGGESLAERFPRALFEFEFEEETSGEESSKEAETIRVGAPLSTDDPVPDPVPEWVALLAADLVDLRLRVTVRVAMD